MPRNNKESSLDTQHLTFTYSSLNGHQKNTKQGRKKKRVPDMENAPLTGAKTDKLHAQHSRD